MEIGRYHHSQIPKPVSFWEIGTTFSLLIMPMEKEEVGICLEIETSQVESEAKRQEKKT